MIRFPKQVPSLKLTDDLKRRHFEGKTIFNPYFSGGYAAVSLREWFWNPRVFPEISNFKK